MAQEQASTITGADQAERAATTGVTGCVNPRFSRHAVFEDCPQCGGDMAPEHAHFRCRGCGWRDSCCD